MTKTSIEWADEVWNPVTGCTKISQGCKNCYAERVANRFWGERKFSDVQLHPERLEYPLHWKKPRRVFVNSMSDLFHKDVDHEFIADIFRVMERAVSHIFMILTKRPKEMLHWFNKYNAENPPQNIWLGVSVENQQAADERIPYLLQTPAAVRFVSCEPLLGPVDLSEWLCRIETNYLNWVICGGESGPNARPLHPEWTRALRDQCQAAGVPLFFKQWGEWLWVNPVRRSYEYSSPPEKCTSIGDLRFYRVGKQKAGRDLDGREWNEYPEIVA